MLHKQAGKLLGCYLLFLFMAIILFLTVIPDQLKTHVLEKKTDELMRSARQISDDPAIYRYRFPDGDGSQAKELLDSIASAHDVEIWLANDSGRILMSSRLPYPLTQSLSIPGFISADHSSCRLTGDFFGMFHRQMLSILIPVSASPRTADYVILHYPMSLIEDETAELTDLSSLALLIVLLLSFLLPVAFYFFSYRPLDKITRISYAYAKGDPNVPDSAFPDDEYAPLQANLKYMAQELNQAGEYQRKFLSNVSHDFRSPLTSIKGYAEAILDGTIPKESQDRYLEIILSETERLTHLTQNILSVNTLKSNGTPLNFSSFDINEVIRSSAASMEIQCRKKDLHITLSLCGGTLNVLADKEKIQQVVYNLLDNAIKFSDPHTVISVSTSRKMKYVFVSVKDCGCGIPADQIPKIWDRFYKSDASRGKDKRGTGLGLSIVKEIIQAHGQNINVISTEGVGSEFIFTLNKANKPTATL